MTDAQKEWIDGATYQEIGPEAHTRASKDIEL